LIEALKVVRGVSHFTLGVGHKKTPTGRKPMYYGIGGLLLIILIVVLLIILL
jgi:hypothetical protein